MKFRGTVFAVAATLSLVFVDAHQLHAEQLPAYSPGRISKSTLTSVGSDSMSPLLSAMVEAYREVQPKVTVEIVSRGSASAPGALASGRASLAPMARPMKQDELRSFTAKTGYTPIRIRAAVAATAIYVSEKNPLKKLSFAELDGIYSSTLTRRRGRPAHTWEALGLNGEFGEQEILPIAYSVNSYHWHYVRQQVLLQGEYAANVRQVASVRALIDLLSTNDRAIVFGPVGINAPGIRAVAVSRLEGENYLLPTREAILSGEYPLARFLNIYIDREPAQDTQSARADFVRFLLSDQGQTIARKRGYVPLSREIVSAELAKLQTR